jgi:hypothetical protein
MTVANAGRSLGAIIEFVGANVNDSTGSARMDRFADAIRRRRGALHPPTSDNRKPTSDCRVGAFTLSFAPEDSVSLSWI